MKPVIFYKLSLPFSLYLFLTFSFSASLYLSVSLPPPPTPPPLFPGKKFPALDLSLATSHL